MHAEDFGIDPQRIGIKGGSSGERRSWFDRHLLAGEIEGFMSCEEMVGSVARLWRFPVKSMAGEQLEQAEFIEQGLLGDRAYALIDDDTGKVVSAKSTRLYPDLLNCRAVFVEIPRSGHELPPVRIDLPNGKSVTSDADDVDRVLSSFFKRNITLSKAAPEGFTIDMHHPDVEGLGTGHRDTIVEQKLGSAFFAEVGLPSPFSAGSFLDLFPVSVLTTSTLEKLSELQPQSRFNERRFRMNLIVETEKPGFVENNWVGSEIGIGDSVRLNVALPDPRCVMTTLAQGDLPKDTNILRTMTQHNRIEVGEANLMPCAGVYTVVAETGTVRTGDRVEINNP